MTLNRILSLTVVLFVFFGPSLDVARAGGSISKGEVEEKILSTDKPLVIYVLRSLDLAPQGSATRIGSRVSPGLGGERVGPFLFEARRAGSKGEYNLQVELKTARIFFDAQNKRTEDIGQAVRVNEWLAAVQVRNLTERKSEEEPPAKAKPAESTLAQKQAAAMKKIQPLIAKVNNIALTPKGLPIAVKLNIKAAAFDKINAGQMPSSAEITDAIGQLKGKMVTVKSGSTDEKMIQELISELQALDKLR